MTSTATRCTPRTDAPGAGTTPPGWTTWKGGPVPPRRDTWPWRTADGEGRTGSAEAGYLAVADDEEGAEPRLRAYALSDLGTIYVAFDRLAEPGGEQRARDVISRSQLTHPELDSKLITNQVSLMNLSNKPAAWTES